MNPSYFAPYAYREFEKVQPEHNWSGLVSEGYTDIAASTASNSYNHTWAHLPPNWTVLNPVTGTFLPYTAKVDSIDYTTEAYKLLWRVQLDSVLSGNSQAKEYLASISIFSSEWNKNHAICSTYQFSQTNSPCTQDIAAMAGALSVAQSTDPALASKIVGTYYLTINGLHLPEHADFTTQSWYWFALYSFASR